MHTFNELFYNTLWTVVVQYCSGQERSEAIYHAKLSRWKQLLNTYSSGDVSAIRLLCRECYVVATEFNLLTASSSASCRIVSPPSNLVCRQESTMWLMVWGSPHEQFGDCVSPRLHREACRDPGLWGSGSTSMSLLLFNSLTKNTHFGYTPRNQKNDPVTFQVHDFNSISFSIRIFCLGPKQLRDQGCLWRNYNCRQ